MIELSDMLAAKYRTARHGLAGIKRALKPGAGVCLHRRPGKIYTVTHVWAGGITGICLVDLYYAPRNVVIGAEFETIPIINDCLNEANSRCIDTIYVKNSDRRWVTAWSRKED